MRLNHFVFALLLAVVGFGSCKSSSTDSTSSTTQGTPLRVPNVGSTFIMHSYKFDSLGVKVDSTDKYDTTVVIAIGVKYQGKTNVLQTRTGFMSYESDGDVSFYEDNGVNPGTRNGWSIIPITSKGKQTFTTYDTTDARGVHTSTWEALTYMGTQSLSLAGHTFQAASFLFENVTNGNAYYHETDYFDTETGVLLKGDVPKQNVYLYKEWGSFHEIVKFDLK